MSVSTKVCKYGKECPYGAQCKFVHKKGEVPSLSGNAARAVVPAEHKGALIRPMAQSKGKRTGKPSKDSAVHVKIRDVLKHSLMSMKMAKEIEKKQVIADYVDVKGATDAKSKTSWADQSAIDSEIADMKAQYSMMRSVARSALGGQHIKIKLFMSSLIQGGAATALANYFGVIPSQSSEWTALVGLYDECRADSIVIRYLAGQMVGPSSAVPAASIPYALGYDPSYGTIPGSVEDVQQSEYSQLRFAAASQSGIIAVYPESHHTLHAKMPRGGAVLNEDMKAHPNFPGSWMACGDLVDSVGYIRYYVGALPTPGTMGIRIHEEIHMEFRIRT